MYPFYKQCKKILPDLAITPVFTSVQSVNKSFVSTCVLLLYTTQWLKKNKLSARTF